MPFTVFYGIIDAIPGGWKNKTKRQDQISNVKSTCNVTLATRSIYSTILTASFVPPTSQSKILGHGFTENNVHKAYQLTCLITKEVKLMFQYKIIHNILPTQMILFRDGISESDTCPLCNTERKTNPKSLVSRCVTERISFWANFQAWWFGKTLENLNLNQSKILYGIFIHVTTHWHALNYSILLAKYYTFCTNGSQDEIRFQRFLLRLQDKFHVLREIAIARKCSEKFQRTWVFLLQLGQCLHV